ncbi:HA-domain-containing protein [Fragilariopsis cylindrus CCMP1102]|uniref:HA-domain-containing protein n=1 Tax=Fragilariopsis cylindrus CCMP1102 TaxID=635003 RepID=A0A1E7EKK7_9STRA|nr:HA-domain-containing protein [Fragilariopsis cylindrus CCMP1102]|eukprot:OEU06404.1 HA-domain-containing protein [Fragilariopsis cylindrus CCMP1102]
MSIVLNLIPWHVMYKRLVSHYRQYGCTSVGGKYGSDTKLLKWVYRQRDRYKTNTISPEEKELLEEIDFVWDVLEKQWEENFALLTKFNQKHGHCNVPKNHKESDENLGKWLDRQRTNRKKGILDEERERRLEMIGIIWEPFSHQWEEMFALLEKFKQKHGYCDVPYNYQEGGESLGEWLNTQRKLKKNGILDNVRETRLTKLGVIMDPITHQWEKMFTLLETFKRKHGHCNVHKAQRETKWIVNHQRTKLK